MVTIQAVIFDMDGVISDTQSVCSSVESRLVSEYGINLSPDEITKKYSGISSKALFPDIFQTAGVVMPDLDVLMQERRKRIDGAVRGQVKAIPGTIEFIKCLKSRSVPMAVASGSHPEFIELVLTELNVKQDFNAICSSYEVENGKPDPELFLLAAKRLCIDPAHCLVIEDGVSGMLAAKRAGMYCVGLVKNEGEHEDLVDLAVKNLEEEKVLSLFQI